MERLRKVWHWIWWECGPTWLILAAASAWAGSHRSLGGGLLLVAACFVAEKWMLHRVKHLPGPGERRFEFPNGCKVTVKARKGSTPSLIDNLSREWGPAMEVEL